MDEQQGFFVKFNDKYMGPYKTLNEARSIARQKGKDIPIYHGILHMNESLIDASNLFLVPKVRS